MLKQLLNRINGIPAPATSAPINASVKENVRREMRQIPRYPPFDNGIPLIDIEEIVDSQRELIDRLRSVCGFTPEGFELRMMSVIRNYARHVHLLPATKDEHHKGAGGLFRLGLEVGFTSMQSAGGKIFGGRESAEKRKILQPRWIYATFIAGMCCELHRPITSMTIVGPKGGAWKPFLEPLHDWGINNEVDSYTIHWTNERSSQHGHSIAAFFVNSIISKENQQYLNEESAEIIEAMTASITGAARLGDGNLLAEIVKNARHINVEKDLKANPAMYGQLQLGGHLEPTTCDAMRDLLAKGDWKINAKQARVWYTEEGMFIVWQPAFKDIISVIESRNIRGFPNNADTLADMLLQTDKSIFEMNRNGGAYWEIMIPGSGKLTNAVKLADPKLLLGINEVEMANVRLMLPIPSTEELAQEETQEQEIEKAPAESAPKETKAQVSVAEEAAPPEQTKSNKTRKVDTPQIDPDFYLNQVGDETRMLISAIRRDYLAKESEHPIWMSARGLVISSKEFNSHGIAPIKVIEDLRSKNWFVLEANSSRLLVKVEKEGVKVDAYIINKAIAEAIGFKEPA